MKILEIELTLEEVEMIHELIAPHPGNYYVIQRLADKKEESAKRLIDETLSLYRKFGDIIQLNTQ